MKLFFADLFLPSSFNGIRTALKETKTFPDWVKLIIVTLICLRSTFILGHFPMPDMVWNIISEAQLLALVYLYFGGHLPKLPPKNNSLVLQVIMALSGFLIIVGVMFKIMHWPGASMNLMAGVFGLVIWLLAEPFFKKSVSAHSYSSESILDDFEEDSSTSMKENKSPLKNHTFHIIAIVLVSAGLLFKLYHWPGSSGLIILGLAIGVIDFLWSFKR